MTKTSTKEARRAGGRPWMRAVLALAALYNLAWGAWVISDPLALFRWTGLPAPTYPMIWQCVGMVVGVYGVGYAIAATAPLRHWPIVLVGLLGKILGPAGFALALAAGTLPSSWLWLIAANDLVWWLPFGWILAAALSRRRRRGNSAAAGPAGGGPSLSLALRMARTQSGESLLGLTRERPRLIVCLRHLGCSFCRETLAELARRRQAIEEAGADIVLVHPSADDVRAAQLFARYGLEDAPRIADPERVLYRSLGLDRGAPLAVLGPRVVARAVDAALQGHRPGRQGGDRWQMPGVFLVADGRVIDSFHYRDVAERPDFVALAGGAARARRRPGGRRAGGER